MEKSNEMHVHTNEPMTYLLCGRMPKISRNPKDFARPKTAQARTPDIDFSAFPPEITTYRKNKKTSRAHTRPRTMEEKIPLKKYNYIKKDEPLLENVSEYLDTYSDNHRRKTIQIHQDWEELYIKPYQQRMKHQLNGRRYQDFRTTRTRAVTSLGTRSQFNALEDTEAASLPSVTIPTRGLDDRIHKYQKHVATEQRLTRVVQESNGTLPVEIHLKERNTVDLKAWKLLPEVRFYASDNDRQFTKGRRPYKEILASKIDKTLDQFD